MERTNQNNWTPKYTFFYNEEIFINYNKVGSGQSTIIFLHGFGLSLFSWDEVKQKIDTLKYTIYLIDLKGFGFSYKGATGSYSVEEQADIIAAFIQTNYLNDVSIVGHSYGGMVALYLLFQNSLKKLGINFKKLILLDTPAFADAQPFFLKVLRNPILSFVSLKLLSPKQNAVFTIKNTFYDKKNGLRKYLDLYQFFFKQDGYDTTMIRSARNIYPSNITSLTNFYSSIKVPTLIIWGKNDELIPLKVGLKLRDKINGSILKVIERCGHVPNEEQPDATASYINHFLMK